MINRQAIETDFGKALDRALTLAKSEDAAFLPGWCGSAPIA
jgi:hypothetical protein